VIAKLPIFAGSTELFGPCPMIELLSPLQTPAAETYCDRKWVLCPDFWQDPTWITKQAARGGHRVRSLPAGDRVGARDWH
jgi:hypothetical protein